MYADFYCRETLTNQGELLYNLILQSFSHNLGSSAVNLGKNLFIYSNQYQGGWWFGSFGYQVISCHDTGSTGVGKKFSREFKWLKDEVSLVKLLSINVNGP